MVNNMDDILKGYSKKEIEELAVKQLKSEEENISYKIVEIDKKYKKHNKQAVINATKNAAVILVFIGIVLNSETNISNIGTDELSNVFDNVIKFAEKLPKSDILVTVYTGLFEGLNQIIEKIGLMGMILATKSVKFITTTLKDSRKSIKIKKELEELEEKLTNKEMENNVVR